MYEPITYDEILAEGYLTKEQLDYKNLKPNSCLLMVLIWQPKRDCY